MLDDENNKNYYKTNILLRFLRFLNILEPDRNVLSISKIYMWTLLCILVAVFFLMPSNLGIILGASGAMVAALLNYSYRRWTQLNNIKYDRNEPTTDNQNYGGYGNNDYSGSGYNNHTIDDPEEH